MALSRRIPAFDRHLAAGSMEMVPGHEWYLKTGRFDLERIISAWHEKLRDALAKGYDGMRVSLSLIHISWMWGPIGAFLSVPLSIIGLVIFNHLFPTDDVKLPD